MNILVFAHDSYLYGASRSLLTALVGINKKADRNVLVILPFAGIFEEELRAARINYKVIPFPRCVEFNYASLSPKQRLINYFAYYSRLFFIFHRLKKIAREFKPAVIYTNTSVVSVGYMVAKKLKIPHVWHVREFGDLDFKYYPNKAKIAQKVNDSEKSIFSSYALKNYWISSNSTRHSVVYNGIINSNYNNGNSFRKFPQEIIRIGLVGNVLANKGQHIAIAAFADLIKIVSGCQLYFFGDASGEYLKSLKKLISDLQLEDKVYFKPFTINKNLIFKNLDLVLNCSKMEGFGRTIVEAMGYGIPVIANSSGGLTEIIDDKISGLLYDGTVQSLSAAMIRILSDKNIYESLGANGMEKAKIFSVENYVNAIDNILYKASLGVSISGKNENKKVEKLKINTLFLVNKKNH